MSSIIQRLLGFDPDLIAEFKFERFDLIVVPAHLAGLDLSNDMIISDNPTIDFLRYPPQFYIAKKSVLHKRFHN